MYDFTTTSAAFGAGAPFADGAFDNTTFFIEPSVTLPTFTASPTPPPASPIASDDTFIFVEPPAIDVFQPAPPQPQPQPQPQSAANPLTQWADWNPTTPAPANPVAPQPSTPAIPVITPTTPISFTPIPQLNTLPLPASPAPVFPGTQGTPLPPSTNFATLPGTVIPPFPGTAVAPPGTAGTPGAAPAAPAAPVAPINPATSSGPVWNLTEQLANPNTTMVIAIGNSEGNRTPDGGVTPRYYGHQDPGNFKGNIGTFSLNGTGIADPAQADSFWLGQLQGAQASFEQAAADAGVPADRYNIVAANFFDLYTQSPAAATARGGFLDQLPTIVAGGTTDQAIVQARFDAYINPATGQLDAPGFGNDPTRLAPDQQRRMNELNRIVVPSAPPVPAPSFGSL